MATTHTIYLTPQQVTALLRTGLADGYHSIQITQGDLLEVSEHNGWILIEESMGAQGTVIDRKGNVVPRERAV